MISAVRHVAMASDFDSKMVHCVLTLLSSVQPRPQPRRACWFEAAGTRATDLKLIPANGVHAGANGVSVRRSCRDAAHPNDAARSRTIDKDQRRAENA